MRAIGYQKIRQFSELVSSCRIYEEDTKAHYKIMNEQKGKQQQSRGKPYSAPANKGKKRVNDESRPKIRDTPTEIVCFRCGEKGHKSNTCNRDVKRCFHCGKKGHTIVDCKHDDIVCFSCGEEGHTSPQCKQPKKAPTSGKMFALAGTQTTNEDRLIRGTCFIDNIPLIAIIDTRATHCLLLLIVLQNCES